MASSKANKVLNKKLRHSRIHAGVFFNKRAGEWQGALANIDADSLVTFSGPTLTEAEADFYQKAEAWMPQAKVAFPYATRCSHCRDKLIIAPPMIEMGYGPLQEECNSCGYNMQCECCIGVNGRCLTCEEKI